jgi:hypothetical protein
LHGVTIDVEDGAVAVVPAVETLRGHGVVHEDKRPQEGAPCCPEYVTGLAATFAASPGGGVTAFHPTVRSGAMLTFAVPLEKWAAGSVAPVQFVAAV